MLLEAVDEVVRSDILLDEFGVPRELWPQVRTRLAKCHVPRGEGAVSKRLRVQALTCSSACVSKPLRVRGCCPQVRSSWERRDTDFIGRFDLLWDGEGEPKVRLGLGLGWG